MQKQNLSVAVPLGGMLLAAVLFLASGCETEPVTQTDIQVRPAYTELARGQSVTLTATGWNFYRWSLANAAIGHLSARVGASVVYTATGGSTADVQVVTATADVAATNVVASGTAHIRHR